jgi:hypothetical protein
MSLLAQMIRADHDAHGLFSQQRGRSLDNVAHGES